MFCHAQHQSQLSKHRKNKPHQLQLCSLGCVSTHVTYCHWQLCCADDRQIMVHGLRLAAQIHNTNLTSTPGRPPPLADTAFATALAAAMSSVNSGMLKFVTQGTAPRVTTPAAALATCGPASGGYSDRSRSRMLPCQLSLVLLLLPAGAVLLDGLKYPAAAHGHHTA